MKQFSLFLAIVLTALSVAVSANAQQISRCKSLIQRLDRQKLIDAAFECNALNGDEAARLRKRANRRCTRNLRRQLSRRWSRQSHKIEQCVERRVHDAALRAEEARAKRSAQTAKTPSRSLDPSGTPSASETRSTNRSERSTDSAAPVTRRIEGGTIRQRPSRRDTAELVKRLLKDRLAGRGEGASDGDGQTPRAKTFRSGLAWSYAGPLPGMHCVQWNEPSDPHDWKDNYLCSEKDVGFKWSFRGPILGRGLKCTQVNEKSDPHDWHDNYFCWPRDLPVTFRFSSTGRIDGYRCLAIIEPSDPHTWRDNYLCHRPQRG